MCDLVELSCHVECYLGELNSFPQRRKGEGDLNCEDDLRTRDELKNELPQKGRPSQKGRQT